MKKTAFILTLLLTSTLFPSLNAHAELVQKEELVYYTVDPTYSRSLYNAAHGATPIKINGETYLGFTSWYLRWDYDYQYNQEQCWIIDHTITLTITTTLPRLVNAKPNQEKQFQAIFPKLEGHEYNHAKIALNYARQLDQDLSDFKSDNCVNLEQAIDQKGQYYLDLINQESEAYDQRTHYGSTEGVYLTPYD